jgi:osmotically-inducible protein OsmY
MADQENIKKNVVDQLYWDSSVDASDIEVQVDEDGQVTLSGSVPSYSAKKSATSTVWAVSGVTAVDNQIAVKYPSAVEYPSDSDIKSNVESILLWNTEIDSSEIEVTVDDNIVTLEGTVESYWKKVRAEELSDVTGVFSIVNKLAVVPTEDVVDEDIAENVEEALDRNMMVSVDDVNVKVENGEVTLTGDVPNWSAYTSAEDSAFYTLGVKEVDNRLRIEM